MSENQTYNISGGGVTAVELAALRQRAEQAERLLHDLTPMGSEFVSNPQRCFEWVQQHMAELYGLLVDAKATLHETELTLNHSRKLYDNLYEKAYRQGNDIVDLKSELQQAEQERAEAVQRIEHLNAAAGQQLTIRVALEKELAGCQAAVATLRAALVAVLKASENMHTLVCSENCGCLLVLWTWDKVAADYQSSETAAQVALAATDKHA